MFTVSVKPHGGSMKWPTSFQFKFFFFVFGEGAEWWHPESLHVELETHHPSLWVRVQVGDMPSLSAYVGRICFWFLLPGLLEPQLTTCS